MRQYVRGLLPYYRHVLGTIVIGSIAGLIMNTAVVLPAILLGRTIDTVRLAGEGAVPFSAIGPAVIAYLGAVLLVEWSRVVKRWCLERTIARIRSNIQSDAFRGVLGWPMARLHTTPIGGLMARIVGDAEVIRRGTDQLTVEVWDTFLMCFSLAAALFIYDWQISSLALLPLPLALWLAHGTGRWIRERTIATREANALLTGALQEDLVGLRVLRLFGRREAAVERVATLSRRQADAGVSQARLEGALQPLYGAVMSAGAVAVVWLGGERVLDGVMSLGTFVGYLELYLRFVERGVRLPRVANAIQAAAAAWERVTPLLAPALPVRGEPPFSSLYPGHISGITRVLPAPDEHQAPRAPVAVRLEGATLRYPGTPHDAPPALDDVTLDVPAGSMVAVTGPGGVGKSALAQALLGLYPLERGRLLFDGAPPPEPGANTATARLGYLPQDPFLFSGSVRESVLMASNDDFRTWQHAGEIEDSQMGVQHAVEIAALVEDVAGFPFGLETEIGEAGIRVSGGQRQRIALARALAAQRQVPGLLVLDDPFSAVDVDTEARIAAALRRSVGPEAPPAGRATIVLCSHRLAAFPLADLVVVLDAGRVVETGTHAQLLAAGGLYARIYRAQEQVTAQVELS